MSDSFSKTHNASHGLLDALQPNTILLGERSYEAATRLMIEQAQKELLIFDPNLSRGDYQGSAVVEALRQFLAKSRSNKLVIVVHDQSFMVERCARLLNLLKVYGHLITVYETVDTAKTALDAFILADKSHYLRRFHIDQARFKYVFDDIVETNALYERYEQLVDGATVASLSTHVGL